MNGIERRLRRLEAVAPATSKGIIIVTDGPDETSEQALARWRAEHPGGAPDGEFIVFVTGFTRPTGQ